MNIQELRIGNYVLKNNAFICAVKELHKTEAKIRFADDNHDIVINYEYIKPIPLTEDILLKCGEDNEHLMVDKLGFVIFKNGYPYQFVRDDYKHLHSLQNLYHSLRGEELNVEL